MVASNKTALLRKAFLLPTVFVFLLSFFCRQIQAQDDAKLVFENYKLAASGIQNISYTVTRIDTFISGDRRSITGQCIIRREPDNTLTGCSFSGKRNDLPVTHWYDGKDFYTINDDEKSYSVNHSPGKSILGSVGGQMLCTEFYQPETDFTKLGLTIQPDYYVLRMDLPDLKKYDLTNRYKLLYLDKNSYLLQKIESFQGSPDKQQKSVVSFTEVFVNDPITALNLNKSDVIKVYKLVEMPESKEEPKKKKAKGK